MVDELTEIAQCLEKYGKTYDPTNPTSYAQNPAPAEGSDEEDAGEQAADEPEDRPAMMAAWTAWVVDTQHFLVAQQQQQVLFCKVLMVWLLSIASARSLLFCTCTEGLRAVSMPKWHASGAGQHWNTADCH